MKQSELRKLIRLTIKEHMNEDSSGSFRSKKQVERLTKGKSIRETFVNPSVEYNVTNDGGIVIFGKREKVHFTKQDVEALVKQLKRKGIA